MEYDLKNLTLRRLEDQEEAGLWITSLPWPRSPLRNLSLNGHQTGILPLGQWPGSENPRRLLMIADGRNAAPETLSISDDVLPSFGMPELPTATMELFERSTPDCYAWERHLLRLRQGSRSIEMALGLRTKGKVHWWEACRLVVLRETEDFVEIEMGGAIPHRIMTAEEMRRYIGFENPYLHKHNWLNGHLYARLHRNGVCEIYIHHINAKCFDDGLDLEDVVPVIGFRTGEGDSPFCPWDGTLPDLVINDVRFDLSEATSLATTNQPGALGRRSGFVVWQPYTGVELYGGAYPEGTTGDPFIFHAEKRTFPRGMARTVRFSLSLSDRSPRIVRYIAPAWWFGVCEEFLPEPLLPVESIHEPAIQKSRQWAKEIALKGGFEDGAIPRHALFQKEVKGRLRNEAGWEGDLIYALFHSAWKTSAPDDYLLALRSAYYFTDVSVDHAAKLVRMHGYPPHSFSLPSGRMQGTLAAYLETGDPYLFETAESVTISSHWLSQNSWPRMAVGRDSCYLRGAVLLYRYFGDEFYRKMALEGARNVIESQRPNGSFGDQGGGTGIHQWGGYITKPWMGLLALNPVLDYLELFPEETFLEEGVRRFADWLMAERWLHHGVMTWSYQHDYNGTRTFYDPATGKTLDLPTADGWHQETLARLLGYASIRFNDAKYLNAWAESFGTQTIFTFDHCIAADLQFHPWLQAKLWNATLIDGNLVIAPVYFGFRTPAEARIDTPSGWISVGWGQDGKVIAPNALAVAGVTRLAGSCGQQPELAKELASVGAPHLLSV